jgi:hypothetical protein
MKTGALNPDTKEVLIGTVLVVLPLVLGYFAKALPVGMDYYMPTLVIGWTVLLLNARIENKKIMNDIQEERKTYQSVLHQLSSRAFENSRYLDLLTKYGATRTVDANRMMALWHDACETIEGTYTATNYINPAFQFGALGEAALSMQHARKLYNHAEIHKIFIHDTDAEMKQWVRSEDANQDHIPFTHLRHVLVETLVKELPNDFEKATSKKSAKALVRDRDFAVCNELFLLEWDLDEHRRVTGGRLIWDKAKVENRKALFTRMWKVSTDHHVISKSLPALSASAPDFE